MSVAAKFTKAKQLQWTLVMREQSSVLLVPESDEHCEQLGKLTIDEFWQVYDNDVAHDGHFRNVEEQITLLDIKQAMKAMKAKKTTRAVVKPRKKPAAATGVWLAKKASESDHGLSRADAAWAAATAATQVGRSDELADRLWDASRRLVSTVAPSSSSSPLVSASASLSPSQFDWDSQVSVLQSLDLVVEHVIDP